MPPPSPSQSKGMDLIPGRTYSYCIWARAVRGATLTLGMDAMNTNSWQIMARTPSSGAGALTVGASWQRICLSGLTVASPLGAVFSLLLNTAPSTIHLDDVTLQSSGGPANTPVPSLPSPTPRPAPAPSPSPLPAATGGRSGGFAPSVHSTERSTSLESDAGGYYVWLFDPSKASVSWTSGAAAHSGSRGLEVWGCVCAHVCACVHACMCISYGEGGWARQSSNKVRACRARAHDPASPSGPLPTDDVQQAKATAHLPGC